MELMEWSLGPAVSRHMPHYLVPASACLSTWISSVWGHSPLLSSISVSRRCLGHMKVDKEGPPHYLKTGMTVPLVRFLWMLKDTRHACILAKILAYNKHNKILRHINLLKLICIQKSNKPHFIFCFVTFWLNDFINAHVATIYYIKLHSLLGWEFHKGRYYVVHLYVQCINLKCINVSCLTFLNLSVPSFEMRAYYLPLYHICFGSHLLSPYFLQPWLQLHMCIGLAWCYTLATPWKILPSPRNICSSLDPITQVVSLTRKEKGTTDI